MSSLRDRLLCLERHVRLDEWQMHLYQDTALDFLWKTPFSALFIDTGLGKTIICLTLICRLIEQEQARRVLVVAPLRVAAQTWPNELVEWRHTCWLEPTVIRAEDDDPEVVSAGKAAYEECRYWAGTPAEAAKASGAARTAKKEEIRRRKALDGHAFHVINIEALTWLIDLHSEWVVVSRSRGKVRKKRVVKDWPYDCVILDESSKFKEHDTARFKALCSVRAQGFITRMHQLTATPNSESYLGLFAQIFLLDLGERLGRNITAYRNQFFHYNHHTHVYKILPGAQEKISDLIADLCMVMASADYLDEQEPLFLRRSIQLNDSELKQYRQMERDFVLEFDDGQIIEAKSAGALSGKLLQLSSGAIYDDKKQWREVHRHKIDDLQELLEELGPEQPLLVAYWYKSSLARLKEAFPQAAVMDKTGKLVDPWNKGKFPLMLMHPAGAAHGLNMQKGPGHDVYFFDMCWSYELYYQFFRRVHRQGQRKQVRVHLPLVRGTNDTLVANRLLDKKDAQEVLFNRIRQLRRQWEEKRMAA